MPLQVQPRRDRKLNRLIKAATVSRLRRGQVLFDTGDPAGHVYLVRSGYLRLTEATMGRDRTVAVAGPWEWVGEEGVGKGRRPYRCVAGEACTYQALEGAAVFHVVKTTEKTFSALLEGLTQDLQLARRLGAGASGAGAPQRLGMILLDLARRWGEPGPIGTLISQRLTHQVLADLAGIHRSTVTTTLNEWLYDGALRASDGGIVLARPERLCSTASPPSGGAPHPR